MKILVLRFSIITIIWVRHAYHLLQLNTLVSVASSFPVDKQMLTESSDVTLGIKKAQAELKAEVGLEGAQFVQELGGVGLLRLENGQALLERDALDR